MPLKLTRLRLQKLTMVFDPLTPGEMKSSPAPTTPGVVASCPSPSDSKSGDTSQAGKVSSRANEEGANEPVTSSLQSSASSAAQAMDESTRPEYERPATEDSSRAPKQLRMNVISYADMHEDMEPDLSQDAFGEDVIDSLETYDFDVEDDEDWDYVDDENVAATSNEDDTKKLMYPYDKEEPQLTDEQMIELDGIADKIEIQRLLSMGVLLNASCLDGTACKQLSTRFVRTWRDKEMVIDVKPTRVWVRRSRFVAGEFAWLSDDKQSMFSPASSSISSRTLPVIFLQHRDDDWILMSCDVQDALLTVKQSDPTMIVAKDAVGNEQPYALGRVLPGQRAGSQLWNEDITNHLNQTLDMVECEIYPSMLKTKDNKLFILLHVDDLLVTGHADKVQKQLIPALQSAYKISYSIMKEMGDELTFLKRRHILVNDRLMLIKSHHKHVAQLKEIMDIHPKAYPKKTPAHPAIDNEDTTSKLKEADLTKIRSAVGVLLYLAAD